MLLSPQVEECDESGKARVSHTFRKDELNLRGLQSAVATHRGFRRDKHSQDGESSQPGNKERFCANPELP
jgi:hypothetical protein